jgi:hypothetical protein
VAAGAAPALGAVGPVSGLRVLIWFGTALVVMVGLAFAVCAIWPHMNPDVAVAAGGGCGLIGLCVGGTLVNWLGID